MTIPGQRESTRHIYLGLGNGYSSGISGNWIQHICDALEGLRHLKLFWFNKKNILVKKQCSNNLWYYMKFIKNEYKYEYKYKNNYTV